MFNKYLIAGGGVLIVLLGLSGFYIKNLLQDNAVLAQDIKDKSAQIERLADTLKTQEDRFKETLSILNQKEFSNKQIEKSNNILKQKLKEIKSNEDDECINRDRPSSINQLLQPVPDEIRGDTNSNSPTR